MTPSCWARTSTFTPAGMDLNFPHHENEIAQSGAATGERFASYWMHNGFLNVDDEKMSKSLDNLFRFRDVLAGRARSGSGAILPASSQYRGPINYSLAQIEQADAALTRLYTACGTFEPAETCDAEAATQRFEAAMDDDFNTPEAIAALQGLAREINRAKDANDWGRPSALAAELKRSSPACSACWLQPGDFYAKASRGPSRALADCRHRTADRQTPRARVRPGTSRSRTGSATSSPRRASSLRISQTAQRLGGGLERGGESLPGIIGCGLVVSFAPPGTGHGAVW